MVSTSKGWFLSRLARHSRDFRALLVVLALLCPALIHPLQAQDDPLNEIHVTPPPPKPAPPAGPPPAYYGAPYAYPGPYAYPYYGYGYAPFGFGVYVGPRFHYGHGYYRRW